MYDITYMWNQKIKLKKNKKQIQQQQQTDIEN